MKILITGGAGFIGSNLTRRLLAEGHEIKTIDNLATGLIENITEFQSNPNYEFIQDTVTTRSSLEPLVEWCEHCYHLAAPVGVKYIMENPVRTILDNIRGADLILELVHKYDKRLMMASTSEIYGKSLDLLDPTHSRKLSETDYRVEGSTRNHRWAYANTKAMDEFLSFAYNKKYGTEVVIIRFFNTVGPGQLSNFGMVIPNFVQKAIAGEDVIVFGSGEQKRSFMHVNDALRAVTQLMFTGKGVGQEFNVGNPFEVTMNELAHRVIERAGSSSKVVHIPYEQAYGKGFEDMNRRTADITKLRETLGFEIEYDLNGILDDVIEFYRKRKSSLA
ncbi:MAG: GDP-mannose 4,6-dehydratase [Bacteroidota bacterium]